MSYGRDRARGKELPGRRKFISREMTLLAEDIGKEDIAEMEELIKYLEDLHRELPNVISILKISYGLAKRRLEGK